nr:MAG TPA: KilAC domain protein [Caudoviricetes sp.]
MKMTQELLTLTADGTPVIDSLTIAEGCQVQHKNVLELIRKYLPDFQAFGAVAFETRPFETAGGTQKRDVALLNEDQATLLFTYLKNTEIARSLKVRVVKAFRNCRDELAKAKTVPTQFQIPQTMQEALRLAADQMDKNAALQKQIEADAPKVSAYDDLVDDTGLFTATAVAKILHMKRCDLFTWLKRNQVAYQQGKDWLPYSSWEKKQWAVVKIRELDNKKTGEPITSRRLRFTTAGIFQMHKMMQAQKINVPEQLNLAI